MNESSGLLQPVLSGLMPWLYVDSVWWTVVGLLGNGIFSSRFVIQWLASERKKKIHVPRVFWYLSFWGSVISLLYAFHVDKLPIYLSFAFLPFLYGRNLILLRRGAPPKGPAHG